MSPQRQRDELAFSVFLQYVQVLDFPETACVHYAKIRAELKTLGTMIGANDLLIAAHARSLGLTLVTNSTRKFSRVRDLTIENWGDQSVVTAPGESRSPYGPRRRQTSKLTMASDGESRKPIRPLADRL